MSAYQICNRCVMDTSDPEIHFDDKGNCNHCNDYFENISKKIYKGQQSDKELELLVNKIKISSSGNEFDCVIGLSGGVDSCYAAYIMHKLGLRAVAVHLDNGWNSEIAEHNIKKLIEHTGFKYEKFTLDAEEFRDLQLAFLKSSVSDLEIPTDTAIPAVLHLIADKYKVKFIVSGGNFATEGILPKAWGYNAKDDKFLHAIQKRFGTLKLMKFPSFGYKKEIYYKFIKRISFVYLLNYVPYIKAEARKVLENETGWQYYGGKHYESVYTGFLQYYILPEKFGIDYRRATFSNMICSGQMSREEALEKLKNKAYTEEKLLADKKVIAEKLEISINELDRLINLPPKSYKDYPNSEKFLNLTYNIYRKLF